MSAQKVKLKVKTGDTVKVIAGDDKGKTGLVMSVNVEKQTVLVEGLNKVKKSVKPTPQNPQGGQIIEKEAPIHISNVAVVDSNGTATRVGRKENAAGKLQRYAKSTNQFI